MPSTLNGSNARATFQRARNLIFHDFFDDVMVKS